MKYRMVYLFIPFFMFISLHAKEKHTPAPSVEALIQKIKQSSADERRVAMNRLKIRLRSMNREARQKVMLELQKTFAIQHKGGSTASPSSKIPMKQWQQPMQHSQMGSQRVQSPMAPHNTPHFQTPMQHTPLRYGHPGGHR